MGTAPLARLQWNSVKLWSWQVTHFHRLHPQFACESCEFGQYTECTSIGYCKMKPKLGLSSNYWRPQPGTEIHCGWMIVSPLRICSSRSFPSAISVTSVMLRFEAPPGFHPPPLQLQFLLFPAVHGRCHGLRAPLPLRRNLCRSATGRASPRARQRGRSLPPQRQGAGQKCRGCLDLSLGSWLGGGPVVADRGGLWGAVGAGGRRDHWNSAGAVGDPAAPAARLRRAAVGDASGTGANVACQLEGFLVFPFGHPHALFYISLDSIFECFPIPFEFFW